MPDDFEEFDDAPARRPRRPRDDDDDRPRRRRRDDDDEGDATGGVIPYKNGMALASYYCGVFSLIPVLGGVLGVIAIVLGVMGFQYAGKHPNAKGKAHAVTGIVLGLVGMAVTVGLIGLVAVGLLAK